MIDQVGDEAAGGHPACGFEEVCPCAKFYDALMDECLEDTKLRVGTCGHLVPQLWGGGGLINLDGFNTFIINRANYYHSHTSAIVPLFWAGFSWSLGTRFILDKMIEQISADLGNGYELRDIEHEHSPIGQVMRRLNWSRHCHNTKHDSKFWLAMSQQFARGVAGMTADANDRIARKAAIIDDLKKESLMLNISHRRLHPKRFGGKEEVEKWVKEKEDQMRIQEKEDQTKETKERIVYIAINYEVQRLQTSFLFEHEMPLLRAFTKATILDLKNHCNKAMIDTIRSQIWSNTSRYSTHRSKSGQIQCVDGSEKGVTSTIVRNAQEQIEGLEAGHARGIIWKHTKKTLERNFRMANFVKCQMACNSDRDCNFFNYNEASHMCEIFHRGDNLQYFIGNRRVISGHKKRGSTGIKS